jgi:hypothetical protein
VKNITKRHIKKNDLADAQKVTAMVGDCGFFVPPGGEIHI